MMYRFSALIAAVAVLSVLVGAGCATSVPARPSAIRNFDECVAAGNPILESYPRQCRANGETFVENIASATEPILHETNDGSAAGPQKEAPDASLVENFSLAPGQSRTLSDSGLRITLNEINDSRCPAGVQCIWAGELSAQLMLDWPGTKTPARSIVLGTVLKKSVADSGYRFELIKATTTLIWLSVAKVTP